MQKKESTECEIYSSMLFDYLSDNLSESDKSSFLKHTESCPECKKELCELNAIIGASAELDEIEVPDSLKASVSSTIAAEGKTMKNRHKKIYKYAVHTFLPIAACTALAIGIYSGGLYDKFINSDEFLSTGEIAPSEQSKQEIDTNDDDVATMPEDAVISDDAADSAASADEHSAETTNAAASASDAETTDAAKPAQKKADSVSGTDSSNDSNSSVSSDEQQKKIDTSDMTSADSDTSTESASDKPTVAKAVPTDDSTAVEEGESDETSYADTPKMALYAEPEHNESYTAPESSGGRVSGGSAGGGGSYRPGSSTASSSASGGNSVSVSLPYSCTITTDNPREFAAGFGVSKDGDTISFTISAARWKELVNYCRNTGAYLDAKYSDNNTGSISVTVKPN